MACLQCLLLDAISDNALLTVEPSANRRADFNRVLCHCCRLYYMKYHIISTYKSSIRRYKYANGEVHYILVLLDVILCTVDKSMYT